MLKTITLENFVHFKDKTVIDFDTTLRVKESKATSPNASANKKQSGDPEKEVTDQNVDYNALNIFVGANFCGKSTVIELIRRCMTDEINVSVTNSFDEKLDAYVFCKFNLPQYEYVISGIIKEPGNDVMYKIFIYSDDSGTFLRSKSSSENITTYNGSLRELKEIQSILDKKVFSITNIINMIKCSQQGNFLPEEPNWKTIEDKYVSTLPLRGIGIVQWTRSEKIKKEHKDSNYKMACERAEVISTLLFGDRKEDIDEVLEEEIFQFITYPEIFEFIEKEGLFYVQHKESESPFPLLKASEGILEAKLTSLLLAHKHIQTLCLEDPDRGMHPQMIERLRIMLHREAYKKTIIVVTHSPYLIDTITINNTHVFFRKETTTTSYVCSVLNAGKENGLSKVSDIETLRTLLFATKVLLVEGVIDKEVVQGIFTQYKRDKIKKNEKNKKDITTFQVVSLGGCGNSNKVQIFCKKIHLPCLCLLDLDNVVTCTKKTLMLCLKNFLFPWKIPKKTKFIIGFSNIDPCQIKENTKKYNTRILSSFTSNYEDSLKVATLLESDNTFIWRHGAVEDAILSSDDRIEVLERLLNCQSLTPKSLKKKLKQRLDEKQRKAFYNEVIQVEEIQRFIHFMEKKEKVESITVCDSYCERNKSETKSYNPSFKLLLGAIIVAIMGIVWWYII